MSSPVTSDPATGEPDSTSTDRTITAGRPSALAAVLQACLPVVVALALGAVVLRVSGIDPFATYALMASNAFGTASGLAGTLTSATPLLFTGLATAVAFRAGIFSLGAEPAFVLGGLTAAWLAVVVKGPTPVVILVAALGAILVGVLYSWPAAWLRVRLGVDEVVSTLMLTFVATGIAAWVVNAFLLAPGSANSATAAIPVDLFKLMPPASLNIGFVVAVLLIVGYAVFLRWSPRGFELHHTGVNPRFSATQGVSTSRVIVAAMLTTGAIAGLGGAVHAMGVVGRFVSSGFSADYGFTGIAVALLARRSAMGIIPAAILFGAFSSAGTTIQLFDNIPLDIVDVLQGTVMIFAVATFSLDWLRRRRGAKEAP